MQTLNRVGCKSLRTFVRHPVKENARGLACIPMLFKILEREQYKKGIYSKETLGLCDWIYKRGTDVLGTILATNTEPLPEISAAGFDKEGSFLVPDWMLLQSSQDP